MNTNEIEEVHKHTFANQNEIKKSIKCKCVHCDKTFDKNKIKEWIKDKDGLTAVCPYCDVDAVIGDASGIIFDDILFKQIKEYFFNNATNETDTK